MGEWHIPMGSLEGDSTELGPKNHTINGFEP